MKKRSYLKIIALALIFVMILPLAVSCKGKYGISGFDPYPYDDLSVYMDLPDYRNFKVERDIVDKLVNAELIAFCQRTELISSSQDYAVQMYDYIDITYHTIKDNQTDQVYENYKLLIGSEGFIDGFEDACIGMRIGETKHINLKDSDGNDLEFRVTLNEIERTPELTDEQCRQHSIYQTKDEFMAALTERCVFQYMWESLLNECELKGYPKEYTEYYTAFMAEYRESAAQSGMTEQQLRARAEDYARSNTITDLLTYSIMRKENIRLEGNEWDEAVKLFEKEQGMTYDEAIDKIGKNATIISVLTNRIGAVLYSYVTITE